jgi:hypothetical protein
MGVGWTGLLWCVPSVSVNGHPGGGRAPGAADYRTGRDEGLSPGTALLGLWALDPFRFPQRGRGRGVESSVPDTPLMSIGRVSMLQRQYQFEEQQGQGLPGLLERHATMRSLDRSGQRSL